MRSAKHNLGNGGSISRQRTALWGVNQPLGLPPKSSLAQYQAGNARSTPATAPQQDDNGTLPLASGSVGFGMASVARIPIPGTQGLFISLSAKNYKGSTSALFYQDLSGKRTLRLDYGWNKTTGMVDYHWNQKGTYSQFGIQDHSPAGAAGEELYQGAKYFKYAGRAFLILGVAVDAYSIVVAKNRWRQVAKVATGWAGAWAGCEVTGSVGAWGGGAVGTAFPVIGNAAGIAIGGLGGCVVGGIGGYYYGSESGGKAYDWVQETYFEPLPEQPLPR